MGVAHDIDRATAVASEAFEAYAALVRFQIKHPRLAKAGHWRRNRDLAWEKFVEAFEAMA